MGALRQRLLCYESVAAIHLSPPPIPDGVTERAVGKSPEKEHLFYMDLFGCAATKSVYTQPALAGGASISRVNGSFSSPPPPFFFFLWRVAWRQLAGNGRDNSGGKPETTQRRRQCRKKDPSVTPPPPRASDLLTARLISLMNSASQRPCPEWRRGAGD